MANLYSVFGLSPGASSDAIKAAYYRLAKQCHPDTHAGETSEERIREINQAYETLGDPIARANYDVMLVRQRFETRRRSWKAVATGASTFVLTLGLFPLLMSWTQQVPTAPSEITQLAVFAPKEDPAVNEFAESFNAGPSPSTDFVQVNNAAGNFLFGLDMPELEVQPPHSIEPGPLELPLASELSSEGEAQQYERAEPTPSPPLKADARAGPTCEPSLHNGQSIRTLVLASLSSIHRTCSQRKAMSARSMIVCLFQGMDVACCAFTPDQPPQASRGIGPRSWQGDMLAQPSTTPLNAKAGSCCLARSAKRCFMSASRSLATAGRFTAGS